MTTYRTGSHWGVTIVREGAPSPGPDHWHEGGPCPDCPSADELVAVVVNGDQALAERICALLNADDDASATIRNLGEVKAAAEALIADSCICLLPLAADPNCPAHHGRRARGPKPPPVGPGCICDGSGRTCPRHGAVI
jgi:hypothetical protein